MLRRVIMLVLLHRVLLPLTLRRKVTEGYYQFDTGGEKQMVLERLWGRHLHFVVAQVPVARRATQTHGGISDTLESLHATLLGLGAPRLSAERA